MVDSHPVTTRNQKDGRYKIRIKSQGFLAAVSWRLTLVWMNITGGVECFVLCREGLVAPVVHRRQRRRTSELVSSFVHTNSNKEQLAAAIQLNKEITCCGSASDALQIMVFELTTKQNVCKTMVLIKSELLELAKQNSFHFNFFSSAFSTRISYYSFATSR
jgi:hypothetical protein